MDEEKPSLFLRRSSGLTRTAGLGSVLAFNWVWTGNSVGMLAAFVLFSFPLVAPNTNIPLIILLATLVGIFVPATYGLLGAIMPRSGGDYHFVGRTLHPAIGFMTSWSWMIWLSIVLGWAGSVLVPIALQSIFTSWGFVSGNTWFLSVSESLGNPYNVFAIGTVVIVVFSLIQILGTRLYFAVQNGAFVLMLAAIVITWGALASTNPTSFANLINSYMGENTHQQFIGNARAAGVPLTPGFSSFEALGGIVLWTSLSAFAFGSTQIAGEIKDVKRSQVLGTIFSTILLGATFAATAYLFITRLGLEFVYSVSHLAGTESYNLAVPEFYNAFTALLLPNPALFAIFSIGFILGGLWFVPQNIMLASRHILAWSFDRLSPAKFGLVDRRFRTPVAAIIIVAAIGEASLFIYTFTDWLSILSQLYALSFSTFLVGLSAILLPYRRKGIFNASPVQWKLAGIPVLSILGLGAAIFSLFAIYVYTVNGALGANTPFSISLIISVLVSGILIFYGVRAYRKRQGIDLDLLYKEIPPE